MTGLLTSSLIVDLSVHYSVESKYRESLDAVTEDVSSEYQLAQCLNIISEMFKDQESFLILEVRDMLEEGLHLVLETFIEELLVLYLHWLTHCFS
jgi:hypothetical protein